MQTTSATIQQSAPVKGDAVVYDALMSVIDENAVELRAKLTERYEFGMQKYNQALMTHDGRNTDIEIEQELLDTMYYSYKGFMETGSIIYRSIFRQAWWSLEALMLGDEPKGLVTHG